MRKEDLQLRYQFLEMKNKSDEPEDLNLDDIEDMSEEDIYKELSTGAVKILDNN